MVAVKAIACELPAQLGLPLSRLHVPDIRAEVIRRGLVADISGATIWQWLSEDAIRLKGGKSPHLVELEVADDAGASSHQRRSCQLIGTMSRDDRLWSTERLRGELLRLVIV